MKVEFISRNESNTRLILIATGWSTGPEMYRHLSFPGWDVAVAYGYKSLDFDAEILSGYYTIYLVAWSLGVFAAEKAIPGERITAAFAINGTTHPVDDERGIPREIFLGTAMGLNPRNLSKFRRRMMPDSASYTQMFGNISETEETCEGLAGELFAIADTAQAQNSETMGGIDWLRAYISDGDRIFPPDNMHRAWGEYPDVEIMPLAGSAHYISIEDIIRSVIADTTEVSRHFESASETYDTHAIAQRSIAIRMASILSDATPPTGGRTLEIGCGTGLFTYEYRNILHPAEAVFVDITKAGPFGIAPSERYYQCDAELWIQQCDEMYDAILSTSAIQWFADIPTFLAHCARRLSPGGILAISTFLPGNLGELDAMRPSPLLYPRVEMLREELSRYFDSVIIEQEDIRIEFRSVRDMLMHLKHTGVAGSAPSSGLSLSSLRSVNALTYRPVYILASGVRN